MICLQETKYIDEESWEFGMSFSIQGKREIRGKTVRMVIDNNNILKENIIDVKGVGNRIILIKLVLGES